MTRGRPLTAAERAALSRGLLGALEALEVRPEIHARAHPAARLAALWRGAVPVLARPRRIFWPAAPADLAWERPQDLALLQHELQHLLDYAEGRLSAPAYLLDPRNWSYRLPAAPRWDRLGAEQRAVAAERLFWAERGRGPPGELERLRALVPWAAAAPSP